ncbi:RING-HC_RNF170 domain-containing protein isoform X1 [Xiphias gladius]|uniref:RING-HC_RNF170 domain-containing protein isoform X1 n=1 Tax=Xiphias gladius TaxID=8245 RepID=UPI001A99FD47|nr:RING-HC_RNF170 domain-containing protein isoform X1 [Xiphias gladius]XP_039984588.1 RING-HC_RNF170 domain-containing protein isoform X1 [Xiphias gladius]XP_039984589.1 RING-HC_RNF170 domain-containing protein isoform X1 [Xiphias gladius]XP_039984590.1 RING-HC_RNF170 domain-containing protein isoform X1 [Xiphias gladius]
MHPYHKSQSRPDHLPSEGPVGQGHLGSPRSLVCAPEQSAPTYMSCHKESSTSHRDWHCPVCLQTASFPVQTNCGHLFCAPCLIAYWRHGSWLDAISCPLCRQKVSVLCHLFNESRSDRQSKEVLGEITDYNKRYSGAPRRVTDYLCDAPLLLQLLARGLGTMGGLVWLFFFRVALCCVGTVVSISSPPLDPVSSPAASPLETDPSLCGLLGVLDDLVVVILLLICVININQQMVPERGRHSANATTSRGVMGNSL